MPFINLIEEQRQTVKRAEKRASFAFVAFVASSGAMAVGFVSLLILSEGVDGSIRQARDAAKKLEPMRNEIKANHATLAELSPRLQTLEDAQATTQRWTRILDHLSVQTPGQMYLTGLRAASSDPTKPIQASFQGLSANLEPVGEFILRLQNSEDLEAVNLKFAQEKVVDKGKGIEFEVAADIAGTAQTPPKKKEDSSA